MKLNREGVQLNAEERNKRNQNWATLEDELSGIGDAIADGGDAKKLAENVQAQVNALVVQGDSSVEARQARVDAEGVEAATLKDRLDAEQNAVTQQLADKASKAELSSLGQLNLNGTYETLVALQTAKPTGATGLFLVLSDGYTYRWNNTTWVQAAQFQSTGIGNKAIGEEKIKNSSVKAINTDFIAIGINYFDSADAATLVDRMYTNTGVLANNSGTGVTHRIYVVPGDVLRFTHESVFNSATKGGFFDVNGQWLGNVGETGTGYSESGGVCSVTVPNNASISYVKINLVTGRKNAFMVIKNAPYPSVYTPFNLYLKDNFKVDHNMIYNTPLSLQTTKKDIVSNSYVYPDTDVNSGYLRSGATQEIVNDFEGFRSASGRLNKISTTAVGTGRKYALKRVTSTLEQSAKLSDVIIAIEVYTNSLQVGETAEFKIYIQASALNANGYDSFSMTSPITLINGVPKVVHVKIPNATLKPFVHATFGIDISKNINPIDLYTSFEYMGYDTELTKIVANPMSAGDYSRLFSSPAAKTPVEALAPSKVYVVANDIPAQYNTARQYSTALHVDHMLKVNEDKEMVFTDFKNGEGDKYYFSNPSEYVGNNLVINKGVNIHSTPKVVKVTSNKYAISDKSVTQVSTKASLSKTQKPRVLFIGDSITGLVGSSEQYGNGEMPYWGYVKKLFELDKIDGGNVAGEYEMMSLGSKNKLTIPINYKNVTKEVKASADGFPGWSLFNFLHHSKLYTPSQVAWDTLGLGDGTGLDYKGTAAQKDLVARTNEISAVAAPANPFFDNNKTGEVKFSILKWLERYRTCDDNGNKLSFSSPQKGTLIDYASLIEDFDVCTPTHIILSHGRNDLGYASPEQFIENEKKFIAAVKAELPNVVIGICTIPDNPGTFFSERYPKILGGIDMPVNRITYEGVKQQLAAFDNRESENIYLLPNYFMQATAWGFMLQDVSLPQVFHGKNGWQQEEFRRYKVLGDGPNNHLGAQAHADWGYQVYSWLKYVMSK